MATLAHSNIPTPKSWSEFEDIVLSAAKVRWKKMEFVGHGRRGQRQHGVDIYGTGAKGRIIGIQCKNAVKGIDEEVVEKEIQNALTFSKGLMALFLATTAERDVKLQRAVRSLSASTSKEHGFSVDVLFWDDICNDLTSEPDRFYQHYPQFKPVAPASSHDETLFQDFLKVLPFVPTIELLQKHDFGASFRRDAVQPLFDFVETWDAVDKEFKDKALEHRRRKLYQSACRMSSEIVARTVPIGDQRYASVLSDAVRALGGPRPEWVRKDASAINAAANEFVPIYVDFVRFCRGKLVK